MGAFLQDLRYGVRMIFKYPGFTLAAVLTLVLGIGANTAIFSVVNAVLLRPLPYPQPERLLALRSNESLPDLEDIKEQSRSFESIGGAVIQPQDFTGEAEPLQVQAALVNADLFKTLGGEAALGRVISAEEDRSGAERVVVLSHGFWLRHFGGDQNVVGRQIPLSGNNYTVIGVMRPDFSMPLESPDVWVALRVANPLAAGVRGVHFLRTYLRLKPDVTLAQAQTEMEGISSRLAEAYPDENRERTRKLVPLHERVTGEVRTALLILFGAVGLVLLVACANFSSLLLARSAARQQELAIRAALGADRGRLVRQVLTESLLLAILGGAGGLVLAMWGVDLLMALKPADLPIVAAVGIDARVLAFTFGVSVLTGVVFGLAPALSSARLDLNDVLKEGGRGSAVGVLRQRVRSVLVVSEVALALMLLIGAGLLIKGFWHLRNVKPGFSPDNLLTMRIELPESRYKEIPVQTQFRQNLLDRLNSSPGVQAAMVSELPLSGDQLTHNFIIDGRPPLDVGTEPELNTRTVGGDYFRAMNIPVIQGRDLSPQDRADAPMVGVVNESFVRQYFPDESPVGKRIRWARVEPVQWMTIVGVVGDVKHFGLNQPEEPAFYSSYFQLEHPWKRWMYLVVRSQGDPTALAGQVKNEVWAIDKLLPVTRVKTMSDVMSASIASQRFNLTLMSVFAVTALLLAAVGIYGVIAFSVTQRSHEIGVRIALGAQTRDVLRLVVGQGLKLVLIGIGIGLVGAFAVTRLMQSLLFGVSATDPATFVALAVLLAAVALLASYVPARRATRVDPMVSLRYE
ncbi:MAG TPA: ABC transporter permease [Pyrinomonadaceae bacterium]|nr:ABC transporter permease [Pyrinomonadaceae bacterium]